MPNNSATERANRRFETFETILKMRDRRLDGVKLLDFGCGGGDLVGAAFNRGIDAYGCDIDFRSDWSDKATFDRLNALNRVWPIPMKPYRLPFPDAFFDVVVSDQVFEHVQNYDEAIAELHRVMKPGAVMLNLFPPKYRILEGHMFVPFGGAIKARWWFWLWALLGVRNEFQLSLSRADVARDTLKVLPPMVNYLPPREVTAAFKRLFDVRNVEADFMKISKRAKLFLLPWLYRTLWCRCLFAIKR